MTLQEFKNSILNEKINVRDFGINGKVLYLDIYAGEYNIVYSDETIDHDWPSVCVWDKDHEPVFNSLTDITDDSELIGFAKYLIENSFIKNIGSTIKSIRLEKGLSKEELRALTRLKIIDRIEENTYTSVEIVERIAKGLGIEPAEIYSLSKQSK